MNSPSTPERRPRRLAIAAGALALCVLALGLLVTRNTVASVAPVAVVNPKLDALPTVIFADGTLSYRNELAMTAEVLGAVEEIYVRQGDEVKRGQPLMKLRSQQYEAQLAQREAGRDGEVASLEVNRASRELAAAKLRRFTELRKQQLVSEADLDEARAAYRQADAEYRQGGTRIQNQRALVDEVRDSLHKSLLRSPIDGTVLSIDVSAGETAVPSALSFSGSTVARIADTSVLVATAKLGEYDVWKIRPGAIANVVVPAFDETPLQGTVRSVSMAPTRAAAGSGNGAAATGAASYEVLIDIRNIGRASLRTGMTCRVEFPSRKSAPVLTVPIAALREEGEATTTAAAGKGNTGTVLVVRDGIASLREVQLGDANDSRQEIRRGLSAEDLIVVPASGQPSLRPGTRVRVISYERG
ncbi:efflux RND transporter periplasmic adaptor subunit [Lysobacter gummosus]|uniref:Efflux RND transporter periplasmic adaptor subunit n=1 Tax=Lysobacter gummosus TaxID=262324 RepID=A0ABY3XAS6_9GAMM|nr:efflux RND transporter periplasmic adaptor subunit [Lysobacter gummosus]ALN93645.1 efflux transporter, RND family, MFP subunit [Lysobacter gummosus]UNP29080.1 efflux RND transporter periplasmic adaptor subunit [Lysobacter gummosus]